MLFETDNLIERVILVGLDTSDNLDELKELAYTAGCQVVGQVVQNRDRPHPHSYIGKGKIEELKEEIEELGANGVICDDELTGSQIKNLAKYLDTKVMDRTMLILDIFARNAKSAEGIAQVEIAQQQYNLRHLVGLGTSLSRLGGGIGTRGPGEKKLETDRRAIRKRISELTKELEDIRVHRSSQRKARQKKDAVVISLVGYTNAGKSTLMNALTHADVTAKDKLFSTLDTTTRKLVANNTDIKETLLTDTVGFIKKLPHTIVKAFRSTLEELSFSALLIHVVDISGPGYKEQMEVVYKTLEELECGHIPIITAFNKTDKVDVNQVYAADDRAEKTVKISAKTNDNIEELISGIEEIILKQKRRVSAVVPHREGKLLNVLYTECNILDKEYREEGVFLTAYVDERLYNMVEEYLV